MLNKNSELLNNTGSKYKICTSCQREKDPLITVREYKNSKKKNIMVSLNTSNIL